MIGNTVNIATPDGRMETYYAHPEEAGDFPVVVIYMDAPGVREELRGFARRIAANGYFCVLPDLYYRLGSIRFRLSHRDEAMGKVIHAAKHSLSNALVMADTAALLAWLDGQSRARTGAWGSIGYCMAGAYVMTAAATFAERMAAGASLYGVDLVTEAKDSPHRLAGKVKGELYFGFAQHDHDVPAHVAPTLEKALARHRKRHRIEVFPDTRHGFCFPERNVYDERSAEMAWTRVTDLFARCL
jgi:carboxymethylenebutenolidase